MRIKTSELDRDALDWVVERCNEGNWSCGFYATDWADAGPIIERERISLEFMPGAGDAGADVWVATRVEGSSVSEECAESPLVAAMRCYVASQMGDEVEVPEDVL